MFRKSLTFNFSELELINLATKNKFLNLKPNKEYIFYLNTLREIQSLLIKYGTRNATTKEEKQKCFKLADFVLYE